MDLYAGIDGTGVVNDAEYKRQMKDSFVSQLYRDSRFGVRYYTRGPTMDGGTSKAISKVILNEIEKRMHQSSAKPVKRIILAGYSRGGAIAIRVARELREHGHKVHGLLLFDAVDMSLAISARQVPDNVRYCFHAIRDSRSRSRTFWGNCGTSPESKNVNVTLYQQEKFMCTHGGMGGVPWTEADPDGIINEALTSRKWSDNLDRARRAYSEVSRHPTSFGPKGGGALDLLDGLNDWHRSASRTAISLRQDRIGSMQVRNWMFAKLRFLLKHSDPALANQG